MVAASAIPAITGATTRTFKNADRNPVNASIPMSPSDEYPCTAITPPDARVKKAATPTVPPIMTSAPAPSVISATSRTVSFR
ncbi:Uncharacterised protein [Mycobacterium tuberculosis]|uniref:Uncharacterized protein n=2 Tax=Mycobacterium tuberculosis TaxID=1773 RepID=A0A916LBK0_MYCTX|nr:Uncharacterised protein [Mycobacterium tuberculosis]